MHYGKAVKTLRALREVSQTKLSERAGLSKSYLSKIESGYGKPTLEKLQRLSDALGVPFYSFMFFASEKGDLNSVPESVANEMKQHLFDMILATESKDNVEA